MATIIPRKYPPPNIDSLEDLELQCEADEANLSAAILSLKLGGGVNETEATYDGDASGINFGHLAFEEYKTDVDEQSLRAIHKAKQDTFVLKGNAHVQKKPIKVLVFREKA
jgi:lipopolysaccharide export system protein LptA